jgi:hypothetical protein
MARETSAPQMQATLGLTGLTSNSKLSNRARGCLR